VVSETLGDPTMAGLDGGALALDVSTTGRETSPPKPRFVAVEIERDSLLGCFSAKDRVPKNVGGRPPKWNWEEFWLELCARVHEEGLPAKQTEMVEVMEQWFVDQRGDHPAESEIKKRVSRLWRRLRLG
jgi:hypothetical protein